MQKTATKNQKQKVKQTDQFELLKETPQKVVEQVIGIGDYASEGQDKPQPKDSPVDEKKLEAQGIRNIQALEAEIADIQHQEKQNQIKKQQEEMQRIEASERVISAPIQSAPKPGRRFGGMMAKIKQFAGMSGKEKVKPPSG